MYLKEIMLENFRNYQKLQLEFSENINVLIGENAQGKTNLLEAIYMLAMASSHRTNKERELILFGQENAQIKGTIGRALGDLKLELTLSSKGKKVRVNHIERGKLSEYIGQLNVILFAPEDLSLVKGTPSERRRFIDREFSQIDALYLHHLSQYRRILKQRNQYLKDLQQRKTQDDLYLDILSEQLAQLGAKIIMKRRAYLQKLGQYANEIHGGITQGKEKLSFQYVSEIENSLEKEVEVQAELYTKLTQQKQTEIFRGTTLHGPHRDDLAFIVNEKNIQIYGSQGQQRTTALAVKLAEIELMKEETGEAPILLLDDVLSELDGVRQTHLLKTIQDRVQTFLTTPGLSEITRKLIKEPKLFRISEGKVSVQAPTEIFYPQVEQQ
ncbi:DNA replication/repair protein RecF [Ligilactobacillus equi]|nr:DNA replication/repair protein RecF [Ligilactobacillus equi]MCQ2557103.1 DNA replication/repair protein RecF [Ligilactobacillus sp.]